MNILRLSLFCLTLLVLSSCHYGTALKEEYHVTLLKGVLRAEKIIPWKIGKKVKREVSMGFQFSFDIPRIDPDSEKKFREFGVDSLLIKIVYFEKESSPGEAMDTFYFPLAEQGSSFLTSLSPSFWPRIIYRVFYAAAYPSNDFRNRSCPLFSHNKKIASFDIQKSSSLRGEKKSWNLKLSTPKGMVKKFELALESGSANGGMSLKGRYGVFIAPFNSVQGIQRGEFLPYREELIVSSEENVMGSDCL